LTKGTNITFNWLDAVTLGGVYNGVGASALCLESHVICCSGR